MSIQLVVEMLDHAPAELTPAERLLLVAIAEKANEQTRMSWPGMETLTQRTGLSDRRVRQVLADLAARGYEVRVPIGVDRHGMPVFATKGHRTEYRVPTFRQQRRPDTAASKGDAHGRLSDTKAAGSGTQRRPDPVAKGAGSGRPSPHEPSKNKPSRASDPSRNGKPGTDWLESAVDFVAERVTQETGKTYDRIDIAGAVSSFLSGKQVTNPGAYIRRCATDNALQFQPTSMPPRYRKEDHRK